MRNSETLERFLACLAAVLRCAVDPAVAIGIRAVGEFAGKEDLLTLAWVLLEPLAWKDVSLALDS